MALLLAAPGGAQSEADRSPSLAALRAAIEVVPETLGFVELQPHLELLRTAMPSARDSVARGQAQLDLAQAVLRRLHQFELAGQAPRGEAKTLFDAVVATTAATHPDAVRDDYVLQAESLRSLLGDWRLALAALRPLASEPRSRVRALHQMVQICNQRRCIAEAWPTFVEVEKAAHAITDPIDVAKIHRYRCALLTVAGMLDGASDALLAAKRVQLPDDDRRTSDERALLAGVEMDVLLANERFEAALAAADRLASTPGLAEGALARARLGMALAHLRLGDDDAAGPLLERVVASKASSYAPRASIELALLELRRGERDLARQRLQATCKKRLADCDEYELNALAWLGLAEVAAGEAPLVELPALRDALQGLFDWTLAQWDATPPSAGGIAFLQLGVRRDLLAVSCAVTLQLQPGEAGVAACLDQILAAEARGSTARTLKLRPQRFADVQSAVAPAKGALLVYLPALTASWLFVVTPDCMAAHRLGADVHLRRAVRRLRELAFASPDTDAAELAKAANAVGDWCLPAAARMAIASLPELAIVGRELTTGLPFECVPWQGSWLGCAKALWDVPSMTVQLAAGAEPLPTRSLELAVLAAHDLAAADVERFAVRALPLTTHEVAAIAAAVAPAGIAVLPNASHDDFVNGPGSAARVTVVLAHGVTDAERQHPNGLLLSAGSAGTGAVFADELAGTADLLLLASCGLGSGGARRGEDGGHRLGGALLQHGARAVVLADGDLGLLATQQLAATFVSELAAGATAAEALRRARAATFATSGFAHPWFHAQLRLVGDGQLRVALTPRSTARLWPWFALLLLAGAVVVAVWRRRARAVI